jgi:polysaccharide export outer membrane protein
MATAALVRSTLLLVTLVASGCALFPAAGPSGQQVEEGAKSGIRIVDVNDAVARQLLERRASKLFSEVFQGPLPSGEIVNPGDVLEVSVWEAPPTILFSSGTGSSGLPLGQSDVSATAKTGVGGTTSNVTTLPQQMVGKEGTIYVPFAGTIAVTGKNLQQIATDITRQLQGKANRPQVLARLVANNTAYVTIVGEVTHSTRMVLTPRGEHLLDALAAAGGTKEPVDKITLQVTREAEVHALPLDTVIRSPHENIPLQPGDVVTALYQPLSFTALGATGKNDEINFEAKGISLAQALARVGALLDTRANAKGVFIFRFESQDLLRSVPESSKTPVGQIPVIYRLDLTDPRAFFLAQTFPMENKDVLYVADAPVAQVQKFLNLLLTTVYPIEGAVNLSK